MVGIAARALSPLPVNTHWWNLSLTFGGLVLDGLLEEGDVLEGAEEQNHLVVLVPDGGHLHVEPDRTSCRNISVQSQLLVIILLIH